MRLGEEKRRKKELECGPMPNVMAAQPNIGGAVCEHSVIPFLVSRRNVWLTPTGRVPCSIYFTTYFYAPISTIVSGVL